MKKTIITLATLTTILISCGPSKEQIDAEVNRKLDSASNAGQQQLLEEQSKLQAELDEASNQETLKAQLIELKAQLAAEDVKMQDIQSLKLLRSQDVKAQEVADQTRVIEELKNQIGDIEKQIKN